MRITESQLRRVIRQEIGNLNRITESSFGEGPEMEPEEEMGGQETSELAREIEIDNIVVSDLNDAVRDSDRGGLYIEVTSSGRMGLRNWKVSRFWRLVANHNDPRGRPENGSWTTNPDEAELNEVVIMEPGPPLGKMGKRLSPQDDPMKLMIADALLGPEGDAIAEQLGEEAARVQVMGRKQRRYRRAEKEA